MALKSVVFPAPFAPMTARRSPAATESEMSSIAVSAPKRRVTPSRTRASPDASGTAGGGRRRVETVATYGQSGTSRDPILNSSFFIPSIWSMPSTLRSTLL